MHVLCVALHTPVAFCRQRGKMSRVQKTARNRAKPKAIAGARRVRYARERMGRPPQPPRSYVTRHIRFRRVIDAGVKAVAREERRGFNDLVQLIVEGWLQDRAAGCARTLVEPPAPLPPRRPRQPRKPPG